MCEVSCEVSLHRDQAHRLLCLNRQVRVRCAALWRHQLTDSSQIMCTLVPLFSEATKTSPKTSLNVFSDVPFMSRFQDFAAVRAVFGTTLRTILSNNLGPNIIRWSLLHCLNDGVPYLYWNFQIYVYNCKSVYMYICVYVGILRIWMYNTVYLVEGALVQQKSIDLL